MERPGHDFFQLPTIMLAERLLGKIFVHRQEDGKRILKGRIVETEAYLADNDEACHAWRGKTSRNRVMFGPPGILYIYFSYGNHYLMNIVSEPEGTAGAVLIRGMEPVEGIDIMRRNRNTDDLNRLMNGPGKLTSAMGIDLSFYGCCLSGNTCYLENAPDIAPELIGTSPRIGISRSTDLPWRKFIRGNPHVSAGRVPHLRKNAAGALESRKNFLFYAEPGDLRDK
jgi:DNA-3-methyladenine glycosylase